MYVRIAYRMYIISRLASASGIRPVNRITNHAITAPTSATIPRKYKTMRWGIAISHCTSGRQLAIFSGGVNVNVAG